MFKFKKDRTGDVPADPGMDAIEGAPPGEASSEEDFHQLSEEEVDAILRKYDKEASYRKMSGVWKYVIIAVSITFTLFQLYMTAIEQLPAQQWRSSLLCFVVVLVFLLFPAGKKLPRNTMAWYDILLALGAVFCWGYIILNYRDLIGRIANYTQLDMIIAVAGIILLFEACRRVVGIPIMIITGCFLLYAYFGQYMPGFLNHRGYSVTRICTRMFYELEGIMGTPIDVCCKFIFLFILFAAFLEKTGIGGFFIDLANAVAGFAAGGPAKVAVLTSALEGTISGSSVANTVGSGSFTIPMMKSLGYKPEFAAAVEATASTGGQIMPPIMGAAAFLMAESIGVPYLEVVKAAIVPAILYFSGVWIIIHLEAKKLGLRGMKKDELPKLARIMKERGHLLVPLIAIVYFLVAGYTATIAALMGIIFSVVASLLKKATRLTPKEFLGAMVDAPRNMLSVAVACGMAGMIISVVTLTGLGLKIGAGLVELAGGSMILTLFFTMIASIILGMGTPTTANYIITSTITAPAIIAVGVLMDMPVPMIAAHMFAFYFGIVADITPPVCLAAMAGAAIAKSRPVMTGVVATKLAIAAFLIPYIFVYNPEMLMVDTSFPQVLFITCTSILGMVGIGSALEGWFFTNSNILERLMMLGGGLLLIDPGLLTDAGGAALIAASALFNYSKKRRHAHQQKPA
ncbi:MAG: TRAP transporter permease [Bacillota bacterium]|nr:TRAP transporter permease [Bacillota bacterium]